MKYTLATLALCAAATAAGAGSLGDPVIEKPIVVADADSSSSGDTTVALLAVLLALPLLSD